ncbi:CYTH domain-containing protein [bacterium 210820-DFI.6.37]|nr:CYTH domain-containing protein [bacterium 210820-DFI.6.37]
MEIELKYAINSKETAMRIWEDEELKKMEEPETRETVFMKATYFDTADYDLCRNDMAYRVRSEGDRLIASLKWGGKNEGALHTREEINVPVIDTHPNPVTFEESDIGRDLIQIIGGKPLRPIMETQTERRRFRIDTQISILEVSIDGGTIATEKGSRPICEVEIELFSGEQDDLLKIGQKIMDKYGLVSEKRSKFYRGLELLGER